MRRCFFSWFLTLFFLVGCKGPVGDPPRDGTLKLVATTNVVADLAATIGGERVTVQGLMGPGVDPHLYKASEGDLRRIAAADVAVYNGLHLEARMGDVLGRLAGRPRPVAVAEAIPVELLLDDPDEGGMADPHIWFDPELWVRAGAHLAEFLGGVDPDGSEYYRIRSEEMKVMAAKLMAELQHAVETVPVEQRVLVTAHDAFGYFGRAFGFEVHGLQGVSTVAEAGAADVQALASFVAERRIPAIFVESSVSPRTIHALQAAVRARGFEVAIGGELFSDALDAPGTPAGTWAGMMRHNVAVIVAALAPEGGRT